MNPYQLLAIGVGLGAAYLLGFPPKSKPLAKTVPKADNSGSVTEAIKDEQNTTDSGTHGNHRGGADGTGGAPSLDLDSETE